MNPRTLGVSAVALLVLLLPLTTVSAQGPEEPLVQKIEEKTGAATDDPAAFAVQQATEEQLADDANWTIAYGCYATYVVTDEAGLPPPSLEECRDFEEALGIAEEEAAEEAVADAQALEDEVAVEAEALAQELETTAGRIVDEPTTAPDEALAFLDRTLRAVERILRTIGGMLVAPVLGVAFMADGTVSAVSASVGAIASGISAVGSGIVTTATAVGATVATLSEAAAAAATDAAEGAGTVFDAVRDAVRGLFGSEMRPDSTTDGTAGPFAGADGDGTKLLDPLDGLVDETTRTVA